MAPPFREHGTGSLESMPWIDSDQRHGGAVVVRATAARSNPAWIDRQAQTASRPSSGWAASHDGLECVLPGRHEQGDQLPQVLDLVMRHRVLVRPGVGAAQPHRAQANPPCAQNVIGGMIADKPDLVCTQPQAVEGMLKNRGVGFLHPHRLRDHHRLEVGAETEDVEFLGLRVDAAIGDGGRARNV